jgi:hypothetical protein
MRRSRFNGMYNKEENLVSCIRFAEQSRLVLETDFEGIFSKNAFLRSINLCCAIAW